MTTYPILSGRIILSHKFLTDREYGTLVEQCYVRTYDGFDWPIHNLGL